MGKFNFYQDCKVTSWERATFIVEASSYAEAVAIVRSWKGEDILGIIDSRPYYERGSFCLTLRNIYLPKKITGNRQSRFSTIVETL